MIRVLVADDHAVVRRGMMEILGGAGDMAVAGEASTGCEALQMLVPTSPSITPSKPR